MLSLQPVVLQARIEAAVRANFLFASLNERQMRMVLDSLAKVPVAAGEFVIRRVSEMARCSETLRCRM